MIRVLLTTLLLTVSTLARGGDVITIGETFRVHAAKLQEDRNILLSLPRGYAGGQERYPVLYLLDGDAHLVHTRGTVDFLARNGLMPDLIIVGIPNTQRTRDLSPTLGHELREDGTRVIVAGSGGGEPFLEFIEKTLMPHVESTYRTQPFRILAGHSLGGLLALHTFASHPQLFQGILAASPALDWDDDYPLRRLETFLRTKPVLHTTLFVSMADEETGAARPTRLERVHSLLKGAKVEGSFAWETRKFPEENHGSVVLRTHYWGLRKVFEGWRLPADPRTGRFWEGLGGPEGPLREAIPAAGLPASTSRAGREPGWVSGAGPE
ncbi:MAG: alpha/beta hydrolase [Holophagaceae bacterium]|nr:alpha/beta hydrolase [Holophagaceae bacterium]